jgi:hypothetical protein
VTDRLFDIEEIPEVPLFREPRRARAARGVAIDERFKNDYPADWHRCSSCGGSGVQGDELSFQVNSFTQGDWRCVEIVHLPTGVRGGAQATETRRSGVALRNAALEDLRQKMFRSCGMPGLCPDCLGMGSWKAMVRRQAGHRCVRCLHPYMPKGDAAMLGVEASGVGGEHMGGRWSACDDRCAHRGPFRWRAEGWEAGRWQPCDDKGEGIGWYPEHGEWFKDALVSVPVEAVEAEWRILTVHHLDGDKANCRWWNLAALCQRCHLEVQAKVVMERIYPHEHSEWFKPYAAGYYAFVYLCGMCGRPVDASMRSWKNYAHPSDFDFPPHVCKPGLELTREQVDERMDELLALELAPA